MQWACFAHSCALSLCIALDRNCVVLEVLWIILAGSSGIPGLRSVLCCGAVQANAGQTG